MSAPTRQKLVNRAEYFVRRRGYNGFSFADLSEDVGIRKASIYYHFPKKSDLLLEMMVRYRERFSSALDSFTQHSETARDRFESYIGMNRNALDGGQSMCLYVSLGLTVEGLDDEIRLELKQFQAHGVAWLESLYEQAQTDGTLNCPGESLAWASHTLSALQGAQISARVSGELAIFDRVADCLLTQ